MGLRARVFKSALYAGCSNGGISETCEEVTVVNVDGPSRPTPDAPPVMLMRGATPGIARAIPAAHHGKWWPMVRSGEAGPMMGGAYIATSDSRFTEAVEAITGAPFYGAVALHDRFELAAMPGRR